MECKDRQGNVLIEGCTQTKLLQLLYGSRLGRGAVKVLIRPQVSRIGGRLLDTGLSKVAIEPFIKASGIDLDDYIDADFRSYNDFFTRRIKAERRPVDFTENHLIAPCDSKLSVYPITEDAHFVIKNAMYSMESLTRSRKAAKKYQGGDLLLFRLGVEDYHRYCYIDDGFKTKNHRIEGVFHTVNPIAGDYYPIYKENTRSISFLNSEHFGKVMMIEVGALFVGRIVNYCEEGQVCRGEEKGRFEFGGSTIILCFEKDQISLDEDILKNSKAGIETKVKYGERIGTGRQG